jgi:hypothetical protein
MVAGSAQRTGLGWRHDGRILSGVVLGDRLFLALRAELQLHVGDLLQPAAELVADQTLDEQVELVILGV